MMNDGLNVDVLLFGMTEQSIAKFQKENEIVRHFSRVVLKEIKSFVADFQEDRFSFDFFGR